MKVFLLKSNEEIKGTILNHNLPSIKEIFANPETLRFQPNEEKMAENAEPLLLGTELCYFQNDLLTDNNVFTNLSDSFLPIGVVQKDKDNRNLI